MTAPTKKQQELLRFIDGFIKGNGYGPSYREVMRALGYKSVSTVAAHVDTLIAKGYLRKGDGYSARSLEVTTPDQPSSVSTTETDLRRALRTQQKLDTDEAKRAAAILGEALVILGYDAPGEEGAV